MNLYKYVSASNAALNELSSMLSETEIAELKERVYGENIRTVFLVWSRQNLSAVEDFVKATPKQRARMPLLRDPQTKGFLVLAAYWLVSYAEMVLAPTPEIVHMAGCSPSEMMVAMGRELFVSGPQRPTYWPFDDDSPFSMTDLIS